MKPTNAKTPPGERIWNFFASVKLTFFLLLALALTSILGTVIPQKEHLAVYVQAYGEAGARLISTLRLSDMYHAPWFLLLLSGLAANLLICSLNRLPDTLKIMRKDPEQDLKRVNQPQQSFSLPGAPPDHLEAARSLLARAVGPVREGSQDQGLALFAQKGNWSRLGVYVVHSSVLIIFLGAIIGNIWGFSGRVNINQGETIESIELDNGQPLPLGFALRLDKFAVSFYKDGMPSEYRSDVTFLAQGKEAGQAVLKVNDPADFQGVDFYQSSYGQTAQSMTVNLVRGDKTDKLTLTQDEWVDLPGGGRALLLEARENVRMGEMYEGPAARIGYEDPEGQRMGLTAFKAGSKIPYRGPLKFEIVDMEMVNYSGLSVKYDPGVWFIWVGCTLMVAGFLFTFYTAHRKVWIYLQPAGQDRTRWDIAGSTNKNRLGLKRLIDRLAAQAQPGDAGPKE